MGMRKRLARAIWKSGSTDPESIAAYLVKKGWRDTEMRPKVQHITVTPAPVMPQVMQTPLTQLGDARSMKPDYEKTRFLR